MSASPGDPQPVFDLIVQQARALLDVAAVTLYEYDGDQVHLSASDGGSAMFGGAAWEAYKSGWPRTPDRGSLTCRAILDGAIIHIRDMTTEPGVSEVVENLGHKAQVSVPFMRGGRAIGAISTGSLRVDGISDTQIELLQTFAEQAVIAIGSAETFRELQSRTAALNAQNRAFAEQVEHQTATIDVLKVMSSATNDTQPVFDIILRRAMILCNCVFGLIFEYDGKLVHLRAFRGFSSDAIIAYKSQYPMAPTRAFHVHQSILDGEIRLTRDVTSDPTAHQSAKHLGHRSQLAVPLMRDGMAIGSITLGHPHAEGFTEAYVELLKTFAEQAVIAIGSVGTFRELQTRTADLQETLEYRMATSDLLNVISRSTFDLQPVLNTVVETAARLCTAEFGHLALRDGEV